MGNTKLENVSVREKGLLTLDRKWNIFFHISMSLLISLGWYFVEFQNSTTIGISIIVASIILIPLICKHFNGIKFESNGNIFNSQGKLLGEKKLPHKDTFGYLFVASFFALWLPGWFGESPSILHFFIIYSALCLYFIYIDCPITYLFDLNIYPEKKQQPINFEEEHRRRMQQCSNEYSTNIKYRNLPGNSHYTSSIGFRRPR